MRPIRLPEPPGPTTTATGVPEIFEAGNYGVIRRAVVIGNGSSAAENQSLGLVRALGLSDKHVLYRVTRPRGGINEWLHWLPVYIHKFLDYVVRKMYGYSRLMITSRGKPLFNSSSENGSSGVGLSSILEADVKQIVHMARDTYEKDGPVLVIASGRDTISTASSIKRLASENVFVVQIVRVADMFELSLRCVCVKGLGEPRSSRAILLFSGSTTSACVYKSPFADPSEWLIQHPRSDVHRFDMVITPRHDYYPLTPQGQEQVPRFLRRWITPLEPPDKHVVLTLGALHQIDFATLRSAASTWHDEFAPLPKPLLVVNIGGPTRRCRYGPDLARKLTASLLSVLTSCGSIRISFSPRTPQKVSNIIVRELADNKKVHIWDGQEPNPYKGHLAWADAFVVTADSVSMLSEACSTGKPVYVMGSECCTWKLSDFHKSLKERGVVRPFTGSEDISEIWSYPPLNDTAEAARQLHETLAQRGLILRP